jgi:hypothetical protein
MHLICKLILRFRKQGRDSSVGTRYGLDGPGIKSGGGEIFRTRPDRPWGPPSPYTTGTWSFPGVKRPRRGVDHPTLSSTKVKQRVDIYLHPPLGLRGLF